MPGELAINAPGAVSAGDSFSVSVPVSRGGPTASVEVTLARHRSDGADDALGVRKINLLGDGTGTANFKSVSIDDVGVATLVATARDLDDDSYTFKAGFASVEVD